MRDQRRIHVIAEAGTNHGGDPRIAARLVDIAAASRAHSVKFQIIYPEGLYLPKLHDNGSVIENEVFHKRASMMLSDDDYKALADYATASGIPFSASVFDQRGIDLLDRLDAPYIKFASCDLNNSALLKAGAETGRKLIISTGMATLGEIEQAVKDVTDTGHNDFVLLHCVSAYPCPTEQANLSFIRTLQREFAMPVGLSDHTECSIAAIAALALGCDWFEKHFTYDRSAEGFDHAYAMEPDGLAQYIMDIELALAALTETPEKLQPGELGVKPRARRGVYAARDIEPGRPITEADILVVRPESAMAPNEVPLAVGKIVTRKISAYEALAPEALQ